MPLYTAMANRAIGNSKRSDPCPHCNDIGAIKSSPTFSFRLASRVKSCIEWLRQKCKAQSRALHERHLARVESLSQERDVFVAADNAQEYWEERASKSFDTAEPDMTNYEIIASCERVECLSSEVVQQLKRMRDEDIKLEHEYSLKERPQWSDNRDIFGKASRCWRPRHLARTVTFRYRARRIYDADIAEKWFK